MNAKEAAQWLGRSRLTIMRWIATGYLPAVRGTNQWEITEEDLARLGPGFRMPGKVSSLEHMRRMAHLAGLAAGARGTNMRDLGSQGARKPWQRGGGAHARDR